MNTHLLFLILLFTLGLSACGDRQPAAESEGNGAQEGEREVLYWVAPMDPSFRRDKPGKSPMGMDLVPVYADEKRNDDAVTISPAVINNLGVRTAEARTMDLPRRIETVGYIDFDESRVSHVHPRTDGWIETLYVRAAGERVRRGDKLFELYSPTLVSAQEEYRQALSSGDRRLIRASRERLVALGVSDGQIAMLSKNGKVENYVTVYASQDGIVGDLAVRSGMYVQPATQVMTLADLSSVWVLAEVFESQVAWVGAGQRARMRLPFLPGREWEGRVEYVYPRLDPTTRTLKVRLRFDNPEERLKPNMYAKVSIHGQTHEDAVVVPRESVIRTGAGARVVLALGQGRFMSREVTTGMETDGWVVVRSGISPGDRVVTSAQFLIDSEASQKASLVRMQESAGAEEKPAEAAGSPGEADTGIEGIGTVRAIDAQTGTLTLEHEPIPALSWPEMRMDFRVAENVEIGDLAEEDRVSFTLERAGDGYRIRKFQKLVTATGTVRRVLPEARTVTLEHGPIPALNWPQMTMDFAVADAVSLEDVRPGQAIVFDLRTSKEGHEIVSIRSAVQGD